MATGYQFAPDAEKRMRKGVNDTAPQGQGGGLSPASNEAIKILSLRLPNVLGGKPIAPDSLLRPGVGGGMAGPGATALSNMGAGGSVGMPPPSGAGSSLMNMASPGSSPFSTSMPSGGGEGAALAALIGQSLSGGMGAPNIKPGLDDPNRPIELGGEATPSLPPPTTMPMPRIPGDEGAGIPSGPQGGAGSSGLADWLFGRSGGGRDSRQY